MTNLDKWRLYTSNLSSPDNYVNWGWRYLVSAFLQRRVWMGPENQACYPNIYPILVGKPGIGKGLVIKEVLNFLRYWKLKDVINNGALSNLSPEQKATAECVAEEDLKRAQQNELQENNPQATIIEPLLIPIAADATTYEALVEAVAKSLRRINYPTVDKEGNPKLGVYSHSSICFALPELASLLRKRTEDTVNYLLGIYDCPTDYEYVTKTKGKDRVRRGCLNIIAGTTPSFMQSIFNDSLIDEGFSSRAFFIFAERNRKNQFFIPDLTKEQLDVKIELLEHLKKLTYLYGNVQIDDETNQFLADWWNEYNSNLEQRVNKSSKLIPYYARKNIHVMKVAMGNWFSDHTEMRIPLECFKQAILDLNEEEKNMHLAIMMESNNPVAALSKRILEYLTYGKRDQTEIKIDMFDYGSSEQIEEAIRFLVLTGKIDNENQIDPQTEKETVFYKLIKK